MKTTAKKIKTDDTPPKKIVKHLGRLGNEYAWLEHMMVDWGDGKPKETFVAGTPDGVFVLPITEKGNILLVHQYRLFNRGWVYEIPGGIIDQTESEEVAALRELEEETGHTAKELRKLFTYNPEPGILLTHHLFVATKLTKTEQKLDRSEKGMTVHEVTPTQLYEMVLDGTIRDTRTVIATLLAKEFGIIKVKKNELKKNHPF